MKASRLTISVPPCGRSRMFVRSAAGFIATSTLGWSPGVRMSWSEKWIWNPETPGSEPAGARISAGKSGSVERSFPRIAVSLVKRAPVSCIPSPESPANRITTRSSCSTGLVAITPCARYISVVRHRGVRLSHASGLRLLRRPRAARGAPAGCDQGRGGGARAPPPLGVPRYAMSFFEARVFAEGVQVGVGAGELDNPLVRLDRLLRCSIASSDFPARASKQARLYSTFMLSGSCSSDDELLLDRGLVVAGVVGGERLRRLPWHRLVGLAGRSADDHQGRALLGGDGAACHLRRDVDERAGRRLDLLAVEDEGRRPADDEVELLLLGRAEARLGVLAHEVARARDPHGVDAERRDAELVAYVEPLATVVVSSGAERGRRRHVVQRDDPVTLVRRRRHQAISSLNRASSRSESRSVSVRASSTARPSA